jgi:hypothetical protein
MTSASFWQDAQSTPNAAYQLEAEIVNPAIETGGSGSSRITDRCAAEIDRANTFRPL